MVLDMTIIMQLLRNQVQDQGPSLIVMRQITESPESSVSSSVNCG